MNTPYTDYPNLDRFMRHDWANVPPAVMAEIRALFEELDELRTEFERFRASGSSWSW